MGIFGLYSIGYYLPFGLYSERELSPWDGPSYTLGRGMGLVGSMGAGWPSSMADLFRQTDAWLRSRGVGPEFDRKNEEEEDRAQNTSKEHSKRGGGYLNRLAHDLPLDEKANVVSKVMGRRPSDTRSPEYARYKDAKYGEENADDAIRLLAEAMNSHVRTPEDIYAFRKRWGHAKGLDEKLALIFDPTAESKDKIGLGAFSAFANKVKDLKQTNEGAENFSKVKGWLLQTLGGELAAVVNDIGGTGLKLGAASTPLYVSTKKELTQQLEGKGYSTTEVSAIFKGVKTNEEARLIVNKLPDLQRYNEQLRALSDKKKDKESVKAVQAQRASAMLSAVVPFYEKLHGKDLKLEADKLPKGVTDVTTAANWMHGGNGK